MSFVVRWIAAVKKFPELSAAAACEKIESIICSLEAPAVSGTMPDAGGVFSKLTNVALYTGAHKVVCWGDCVVCSCVCACFVVSWPCLCAHTVLVLP